MSTTPPIEAYPPLTMPVSPSRQRCTDPYEPFPSSQMMRYLLMMMVPLLSLRFTTLTVSRKLDLRSECDDELADWPQGRVKLLVGEPPLPSAAVHLPLPPGLPAPLSARRPLRRPPPSSPPGLRLDGLTLDRDRIKRLDCFPRPRCCKSKRRGKLATHPHS